MLTQSWLRRLLYISLASIASAPVNAQIAPDSTLDSESSRVSPSDNINLISGGAQRGNNLFHSFSQFNINDGQRVYFSNPPGVENILTRVTGTSASNILGTLGVEGQANLFLINPNGILFGANARLDIKGSFVGTTANTVKFGEQGIFSATKPESVPLLTIKPSALLFNQISSSNINVLSKGDGLTVPEGRSLMLVGGNINIDAGNLEAKAGNVELVGVKQGNVKLTEANNNFSSLVADDVERADVSLKNGAKVNVVGAEGNLKIYTHNLTIEQESSLFAGIDATPSSLNSKAGDITINANSTVELNNNSIIINQLFNQAIGQSGDINIKANSLNLNNGSFLSISSFGEGNAGNVNVDAQGAVTITGINTNVPNNFIVAEGRNFVNSGIFSNLAKNAEGNGGTINIKSGSLKLSNGGSLSTSSFGKANAGNININVKDAVIISGGDDINSTVIQSILAKGSTGNGGDININSNSFELLDGASLTIGNTGQGKAGNININAKEQVIITGNNQQLTNKILSFIGNEAIGNGGNINIKSNFMKVSDSAIGTSTSTGRESGNIDIYLSNNFIVTSSAISSAVFDSEVVGNAGNIKIQANNISLNKNSILLSSSDGKGNAGNIFLEAKNSINIANKSYIDSSVQQKNNIADGGEININARALSMTGESVIRTTVIDNIGKSGNINIRVSGDILVSENSLINSSNFGEGNAGAISIYADGTVLFNRSDLLAVSLAGLLTDNPSVEQNDGGNIKINSGNFILSNNSILTTLAFGNSNAGNISINSKSDVNINTGSSVSTQVFGAGSAGNVDITANGNVLVDGSVNGVTSRFLPRNGFSPTAFPSRITTELVPLPTSPGASNKKGQSGNINITSSNLSITNNAKLSSSTSERANAGNININTDTVNLDNGGNISAKNDAEDGGDINLTVQNYLLLRRNSFISTDAGAAQAGGNGGNININTPFIVAVPSENSDITASAFSGSGGNVNIRTQSIFGITARSKTSPTTSDITASSDIGVQGQISIQEPEIQPSQSIIELPEEVVDATRKVAEVCPKEPGTKPLGEFIITGRGSLPPNPLEIIAGTSEQKPLVSHSVSAIVDNRNSAKQPKISNHPLPSTPQIVEAQSWVRTKDGSIALVAVAPQTVTNTNPTSCPKS
jgi:filamentous hemagglutinin family protein